MTVIQYRQACFLACPQLYAKFLAGTLDLCRVVYGRFVLYG
ncbi:MAG: hypothetical protein AVDCRST_MAG93-22, partial [uncultured Chloroflexia bacterium]